MAPTQPLIVIVDDEECVRRALNRLLRAAGFRVQSFDSGAQFIESLGIVHPACVVLDLHMPGMSGFDVQLRLKDAGIPLPVVVITGHDTDESQQRALHGGAVAYLRKPVDDQALLSAIAAAVASQ